MGCSKHRGNIAAIFENFVAEVAAAGTAGPDGTPGRAGAAAAHAPDAVSRSIRPTQQAARGSDAGSSRQGPEAAGRRGRRAIVHAPTCGDELGEALEAGIRDRHRSLRALRREAQDHCQEPAVIAKILAHLKRTAPDQYQSELPRGGEGAAAAVQAAVNPKSRSDCAGR
jgi:hypothetical protein